MRLVPLPVGGARLLDLVHVSDVVEAALAAASAPAAVGHAYNLTDGESHSYRDILDAFARFTGRRPAIVSIPGPLFRLGARLIPGLRPLGLDLHYAIDAARRDLDYRPQVGLSEGLGRMLARTPASPARA
jgi:nucleoside-diphosphate-sugar epimerase